MEQKKTEQQAKVIVRDNFTFQMFYAMLLIGESVRRDITQYQLWQRNNR